MKYLFSALLFLLVGGANAQFAIKAGALTPTGEFGFVMKKTATFGLYFMDDTEDAYRLRFGGGYTSFKPRLDTFPTVGYQWGNGNTVVLPGYEVYHKYNMLLFDCGADFTMLKYRDFCFYPGFDVLLGLIAVDYESYTETIISESYSGSYVALGYRFRLGCEYLINDNFATFIEASRSKFKVNNEFWSAENDYSLGLRYILD
jgi:hypothetical protein